MMGEGKELWLTERTGACVDVARPYRGGRSDFVVCTAML